MTIREYIESMLNEVKDFHIQAYTDYVFVTIDDVTFDDHWNDVIRTDIDWSTINEVINKMNELTNSKLVDVITEFKFDDFKVCISRASDLY